MFSNYFDGRTQLLKVDNTISNKLTKSSGVPQCSSLGPILNSVYVADVPGVLSFRWSALLCR